MDFENEAEAYGYFVSKVGLGNYTDIPTEAASDFSDQLSLIGFGFGFGFGVGVGVGASAI